MNILFPPPLESAQSSCSFLPIAVHDLMTFGSWGNNQTGRSFPARRYDRNAGHLVLRLKKMYNITNICGTGSNGLQTRADFKKAKPLIDRAYDEN